MWRIVTILGVTLACAVACERGVLRRHPLPFAVLWLATLLAQTFAGRTPLAERAAIVEPFHALWLVWSQPWVSHGQWTFCGIAGNVLLFVPLGMVLCANDRRGSWVLVPMLASLAVECTQWRTCLGTFEVDDVICNVVGCMLGHWLGTRLCGGRGGFCGLLVPGLYLLALAVCCARSILFA